MKSFTFALVLLGLVAYASAARMQPMQDILEDELPESVVALQGSSGLSSQDNLEEIKLEGM